MRTKLAAITVTLAAGLWVAPLAAEAQPGQLKRIGSRPPPCADRGGGCGPDARDPASTPGGARSRDRILKGARAGDLPVERAARFDLAVNLKTAKALRLTIPDSILMRATKVIRQ